MGYRSDVAYRIQFIDSPEGERMFKLFLAEIKSREDTRIAVDEVDVNEDKREISFSADSLKWYDSFQDVISHQTLWHLAEEYDSHYSNDKPDEPSVLHAAFIRLGESVDDVEERSINEGYELLYVSRIIMRGE